MRVSVVFLRTNGIRRRQSEIGAAVPMVGDLTLATTFYQGGTHAAALTLLDPGNQADTGVVARLIEPVLEGLGNGRMRFRGIERVETKEGKAAVVQEWLVEILHPDPLPPPAIIQGPLPPAN